MAERAAQFRILVAFWVGVAVVAVVGYVAIAQWSLARPLYSGPFRPALGFLEMWTRFDGGWYQQIATDGYFYDITRQSSIVFFPTYPLVVRALTALGLNPYLAGFLITVTATSVAIVALLGWQRDHRYAVGVAPPDERARLLSVVAWLVYPYAWFLYGAVYSDALFAAVAIGSFWLLERRRPAAAGVLAIAATAGRPFGWAVTVGLAIRAVEHRWRDRHDEDLTLWTVIRRPRAVLATIRLPDLAVGLSGLGVAAYLSYLWARFGSPRVFIWNQAHWGQGSGDSVLVKSVYWDALGRWDADPLTAVTLTAQGIIGLGLLTWGTVAVRRRFGLGLAAYVIITVAPAVLFTKDFQGMGRYALAVFPVFAVVGWHAARIKRSVVVPLVLGSSALVMVTASSLFARGFYLS